jgi:Tfp pilus assembly pilus retraction ATPase PilT
MLFEEWIEQAYSLGASDLHLEADTPIVARIRGELQTVGATVSGATLRQVARELLRDQWQGFLERGSADHANPSAASACGPTSFRPYAASPLRSDCWRRA